MKTAFRASSSVVLVSILCIGSNSLAADLACCGVTSITKNGEITAKETNGARTFQFQVTDAALRSKLRIGSPVYANFATKQVSLDGKKTCCTILGLSTAERRPVPGQSRTAFSPSTQSINWFRLHGGRFHASTDPNRPVILLVHGLHSSAHAWTSPANDPGVGGYYYEHRNTPPKVKLENQYPGVGIYKEGKSERSREQVNASNWFEYLVSQNYTVATWSQPGETFQDAYPSAEQALENLLNSTQGPVALVGHSRGGLVIRKLLKEKVLKQNVGAGRVRWVFTLHSPHSGSELAKGPQILLDEVGLKCGQISIPNDWLPKVKDMCNELLNELAKRLAEPGSLELTPGGPVLGPLAQGEAPVPGVSYYTFGGTSPTYIRYYLWRFTADSAKPQYRCEGPKCKQYFKWEAVPHEIPAISPMYDVVRDVVLEIKPGHGDGLVADARARLPFATTHATNSLNHAEVLWSRKVQQRVVRILSGGARPSMIERSKGGPTAE